ncbi:MAG: hypothetical protein ABDH49_04485 [Candidatus Hydrothermales bacterium]
MSEIVIESSSKFPSIGIKEKNTFKVYYSGKEGNHSTFFFEILNEINLNNVELIIITIGPGRFTSLRVGLSLALGIAIPRKIEIVPLVTFDVIEHKISNKFSNYGIFLKKGSEGFLFRKKGDSKIYIVKELIPDIPLFTFEPAQINYDYNLIILDPFLIYEFYEQKKDKVIRTADYEKIKPLYSFLPYEKSLIEKGKIKGFT